MLGYAITVHKSQGSQAKVVIYAHPSMCSPRLACSEMVYTAVTRAMDKVIIIGTRISLNKAIKNKELNSKQTLLSEFLDGYDVVENESVLDITNVEITKERKINKIIKV